MDRRRFLAAAAAAPLLVSVPPAHAASRVRSLDDALRWLDTLERTGTAKSTGAWPLVAVFDHLAQSVEMSIDGFPRPKGALFQNTVGTVAFTVFRWRGRMTHALDEPIPGAPPLATGGDWRTTAVRLRVAIRRFSAHGGALMPHFAYGRLDKADYALAHTWHIANHQDEIVAG